MQWSEKYISKLESCMAVLIIQLSHLHAKYAAN